MTTEKNDDRQAYTGIPLKEGEVLVPVLATRDFIDSHQLSSDKLRTWAQAGVPYQVVFQAVPAESKDLAMGQFNFDVNELLDEKLGPNRNSRCLIPQADGSVKVCPKKRGNNRVACKDCPNRGIYEKEDKSVVSLDEIRDEYDLLPVAPDDTEKEPMLPMILKDLMADLKEEDERIYDVLILLSEGNERKDIVTKLAEKYDIKASRAYSIIKDAVSRLMEGLDL